jgi:nucleoside-diphosphate-sugar epimerase
MKKNFKLFCFGFGQVAKYFVKSLVNDNTKFDLIATNTSKTELKSFNNIKYKSYHFFNNEFDKDLLKDLYSSHKVIISIPPKNKTDIVIKNFRKYFKQKQFNWITYLSATSVYGDKKGKWVDEKSSTKPTSNKGNDRLNAEKKWMKLYKDFKLPIQIFRLSGIYSIENNIIKRINTAKFNIIKKNNHFFSRIHIEDIAEILKSSIKKFKPGEIYNISDNYPCSNEEIANYALALLKLPAPKKINAKDINDKILRNFYRDSKKVSNKKMKKYFNYKLRYPTYKEGLDMIKNHKL